jgi:mannose-6-phosphate isomerase-like protein (cupin superfamily)
MHAKVAEDLGSLLPTLVQPESWASGANSEAKVSVILVASAPDLFGSDGQLVRLANKDSEQLQTLPIGRKTTAHYHPLTEEIYYILEGCGALRIGEELQNVGLGDAIAIPPGATHQIENTGSVVLKFLCCCAPGYQHEDTVLLDE